jgi:hypothetical protein
MSVQQSARKLPGVKASTWLALIAKSAAGAALVAAAAIGIASALRMLAWTATADEGAQRRIAMWVVFLFATAVLGGVAMARHSVRTIRTAIANRRALAAVARATARQGVVQAARARAIDAARGTAAVLARVGAAVAAGAGAAAAFVLIWIPARDVAVPAAQVRSVALAAGAGIAVGLVLAIAALYAAPIAVGVATTAIWVWAVGLASVWLGTAAEPTAGAATVPPRLAVLDAPHLIGASEWWLGPYLMVAVAAMLGVAVAATARSVGSRRLTVAASGLAGPALVAAAYLVTGTGTASDLVPAYVAALLAVTVGLLASATTAAVHRHRPAASPSAATTPALRPALPAAPVMRSAPLAIEAARTAAPTRVTLEAEYASSQPRRGAAPLYEVTAPSLAPQPATIIPAPAAPPPPVVIPATAVPSTAVPAAAMPASAPAPTKPAQTVPAQTVPAQTKPARAKPARAKSARSMSAPAQAGPVERPAQVGQAPAAPAATRPAQVPPAETRPADTTKPAEPKPAVPAAADPKRRQAKPARKARWGRSRAAAEPVSVASNAAASTPASTPASPPAPKPATKPSRRLADNNRGRTRRETRQERHEREHVDWVKNLVNLPNDPSLTPRSRS